MTKLRNPQSVTVLLATLVLLAGALAPAGEGTKSEQELIETLRNGPPAEKALACKHLATLGTKAAVGELAPLLADPRLASWARIALEAIPDPAADEALRGAVGKLQGRLLVGAIHSLAVRRDAAAVDLLSRRLTDPDVEVASAAAVALGCIANDAAAKTLRHSLAAASGPVRDAVAEGCILCAERLLNGGRCEEATDIYDQVRLADVSRPRKLEATRGAILARKSAGIPLLIEQLRSPDRAFYQIGLSTARELAGHEAADALATELTRTSPERAATLLYVLADRGEPSVLPAVVQAAKSGDKKVRIVALGVVGKLGDATSLGPLLEIAGDSDAEVAQAAKAAIVGLDDANVDAEIRNRLAQAEARPLVALIEVAGLRRIEATELLTTKLNHPDPAVRGAAVSALGATVGPKNLGILISQATGAKDAADQEVAGRALRAACLRMPDREACAAQLAAAMPGAPLAIQATIVEILGAMGGAKALETIDVAMRSNEPRLQDAGSRVLGEWMSVDAAPVLLNLLKNAAEDKYRLRALRGYIRLARQFAMPDGQRAEMCQVALNAASRPEEQKLVLAVLERYPSLDALKVAAKATEIPALRGEAKRVALAIAEKLGDQGAKARDVLAASGLEPVQVEIVKAEYGAGSSQIDVTQSLQKWVDKLPLIMLPSPTYNDSFGADPAPGEAKTLKVQYRINGKSGDASFAENALIVLPMPK